MVRGSAVLTMLQVHVPIDVKSGNGKGFAYVQFFDPGQALLAYKSLDGLPFQGRLLHILPAARKQESKLDEFDLSKLPIKKQRQLQKRASAATSTINWNALYMNVSRFSNMLPHAVSLT